jgi:hypothetical protein
VDAAVTVAVVVVAIDAEEAKLPPAVIEPADAGLTVQVTV